MMRIKHVAIRTAGGTPEVSDAANWDDDGFPWVTISDMTREPLITTTGRRVSEQGMRSKNLPKGRPGTVLFAMYASVGQTAELGVEASWNQAILGLQPRNELCSPRFLRYLLSSHAEVAKAQARGSTQDNLNANQVANFPFPDLDLESQLRIAAFLDRECAAIDAMLSETARQGSLLVEREASALSRFLQFGQARTTRLANLVEPARPITYGIVLPGPHVDNGVPIVKSGDVAPGRLDPERLRRTSHEIEASYPRSRLVGGDLVISIRGSVGAVEIVPAACTGANLTQDAARIAPTPEVSPEWLSYALRSPEVQAQIDRVSVGATIKGLNIRDLRRLEIPDVPMAEQHTAVQAIEAQLFPLQRLQAELGAQRALLTERRQAIITAAVTGELKVA